MRRGTVINARISDNKIRPYVVVSNDKGNKHSPNITVAYITSSENQTNKTYIPTVVSFKKEEFNGLIKDGAVFLSNLYTVPKEISQGIRGYFDKDVMTRIDKALQVSLNLQGVE